MTTLVEMLTRASSTADYRPITLVTTVAEGDQIFYLQVWEDASNNITADFPTADIIVPKTHLAAFTRSFELFKITATAGGQTYGPTMSATTLMGQHIWNLRNASSLSLRTTGSNDSGGASVITIVAADADIPVVADEFCIANAFTSGPWTLPISYTNSYTYGGVGHNSYVGHKLIVTPESTNTTITATGNARVTESRLWVIATEAVAGPTHPFTSVTIS